MPDVVVAVRTDRLTHMDIIFIVGCAAPQGFSMRAAAVAASAVVVEAHPLLLVACPRGGVDRPVAGCGKGDEHLRTIGHRCGMSWWPPAHPACTSCQVSRAYRSEHDGHTCARRLLHRVHTTRSRPNSSVPVSWIGWAQNPTDSARRHHDSNPIEDARRTI